MCGFLGYYCKEEKPAGLLNESLAIMRHRGPDNQSFTQKQVASGFLVCVARLSIIDTSEHANQPLIQVVGAILWCSMGKCITIRAWVELVEKATNFQQIRYRSSALRTCGVWCHFFLVNWDVFIYIF